MLRLKRRNLEEKCWLMSTKMLKEMFLERLKVPKGTEVIVADGTVVVKGKRGEVSSKIAYPRITVVKEGESIVVKASSMVRKYKRMVYTYASHIKNMIEGANEGYVYKLKICAGHFPMTVKADGKFLVISNFLGEKTPRKALILDNVKVSVSGDVITVESADLNNAGQTAANIETATKIKNRDRRVFQDGIYLIEKPQ